MHAVSPFLASAKRLDRNKVQIAKRTGVVKGMARFVHVFVSPLATMATNKVTADPALLLLDFCSIFDDFPNPD
jgi:hypothetical protein